MSQEQRLGSTVVPPLSARITHEPTPTNLHPSFDVAPAPTSLQTSFQIDRDRAEIAFSDQDTL